MRTPHVPPCRFLHAPKGEPFTPAIVRVEVARARKSANREQDLCAVHLEKLASFGTRITRRWWAETNPGQAGSRPTQWGGSVERIGPNTYLFTA